MIGGICSDDKKLILIDKDIGMEMARSVIIHEILHAKHFRLGDLSGRNIERVVEKETSETYYKLYGIKI